MDAEKHEIAERLAGHIASASAYRSRENEDAEWKRDRHALRAWQSARLARTHQDLLASERYQPAAAFFLEELYGPKDFGERDTALERVQPMLSRFLPRSALETICKAIELDALSESLDAAMVDALRAAGKATAIDESAYAAAYRTVGQRRQRNRQIALIRQVGEPLDELTHHPMIRGMLRLMGGPARAVGLGALHAFLVHGFEAFAHMQGADEFLERIVSREQALSDRLLNGETEPFGPQNPSA
ncbi:hypothetical protein GCM10025771_26010 [Niveibacterium umoris]|uniref:DUF8198 domain-containing protein n=1 Tax=Niveibacterium umoris TaxID=1193620 RepID=A0A840BGV4_9RHOO|nr:hypothetical protein [Niveibacterium umoris]MBB4012210.1 hypothetical protein [Niveibacterium umoris]